MYEISVIVPSFNKASHLRRNLLSLSVQTFAHDRFEALVVDDGSTDDSKRIVDEARTKYDFRIRYFYLRRSGDCSPALTWNYGIVRASAPVIVQAGADIMLAHDTLALLYDYQQDSDGNQYTFANCYRVHSRMSNALLDFPEAIAWQRHISMVEAAFIEPYHHSSYWRVPMLAALPKAWFEKLRGYDESYPARTWPDDSDFWVRVEACGVMGVNAPDVWGAHQYHPQKDIVCEEGCDCPLSMKSKTHPGKDMKYCGTPEDLFRNPVSWGEYHDSYEA